MFHVFSALVFFALLVGPAAAQQLYLLGGGIHGTGYGGSSTSWQLDYRQELNEYLAASVGYLNEGHISSHHRDGQTAQLWLGTRLADGKLSLSIGIGPYLYYD